MFRLRFFFFLVEKSPTVNDFNERSRRTRQYDDNNNNSAASQRQNGGAYIYIYIDTFAVGSPIGLLRVQT